MSSRQGVVLASRVLCVFFLYSAFGALTTLPIFAITFSQEWQMLRNHAFASSTFRLNTLSIETAVLRLSVDLLLAYFFYHCGPRLTAFLTGEAASATAQVSPTA